MTKGNARGSGYDRNDDDWYVESEYCVNVLLKAEPFLGTIWDPACGGGNIPRCCMAAGHDVIASDLRDRGYGETGVDFLATSRAPVDNIISNPPFNLMVPFVQHALRLTTRKVAMVGRLAFLEGRVRNYLFRTTPLARVWVHSARVSMPPGGKAVTAKNGSTAYAWFVFEHGYRGKPELGWLL